MDNQDMDFEGYEFSEEEMKDIEKQVREMTLAHELSERIVQEFPDVRDWHSVIGSIFIHLSGEADDMDKRDEYDGEIRRFLKVWDEPLPRVIRTVTDGASRAINQLDL